MQCAYCGGLVTTIKSLNIFYIYIIYTSILGNKFYVYLYAFIYKKLVTAQHLYMHMWHIDTLQAHKIQKVNENKQPEQGIMTPENETTTHLTYWQQKQQQQQQLF